MRFRIASRCIALAIAFAVPAVATAQNRSIQNGLSGRVLDLQENAWPNNGANVQQWEDRGTPNQLWQFVWAGTDPIAGPLYTIENSLSGKVLTVDEAQLSNDGANVFQFDYLGSIGQLWHIDPAGGGWVKIVNFGSGKVLDVVLGDAHLNGANVQQWQDRGNGAHNQFWFINSVP